MSPRPCFAVAMFLLLVLITGCSSDSDDSESRQIAQAEPASETAVAGARQDVQKGQAGPAENAALPVADLAIDPNELNRVAVLEPDDAIERYRQECNARDYSHRCRALRRRVEYLLLDAMISLRSAGVTLDPQLYRVAARAGNPQLAIIGLRGLMLAAEPVSANDEQLIAAGLDHPYAGVRRTVLELATNLQTVSNMRPRVAATNPDTSSTIIFLDETRSSEPDPAVIGSYPDARYRYFASNETRQWFTTTDPPEKVIAFLTRDGKQAFTAEALNAKTEVDWQQEYMKAAMSGDETKIAEVMQKMTAPAGLDWTASFKDLTGTGEIRYVELTPDHVVAVFSDDILQATSIVAPLPPAEQENPFAFDAEQSIDFEKALEDVQKQAELEERVRQVLGHR